MFVRVGAYVCGFKVVVVVVVVVVVLVVLVVLALLVVALSLIYKTRVVPQTRIDPPKKKCLRRTHRPKQKIYMCKIKFVPQ